MVNIEIITKVFSDKAKRDVWIARHLSLGYTIKTWSYSRESKNHYWTIGVYKT